MTSHNNLGAFMKFDLNPPQESKGLSRPAYIDAPGFLCIPETAQDQTEIAVFVAALNTVIGIAKNRYKTPHPKVTAINNFILCNYSLFFFHNSLFKALLQKNYNQTRADLINLKGAKLFQEASTLTKPEDSFQLFRALADETLETAADPSTKYAALNKIGEMFRDGIGTWQDPEVAFKHFLQAANGGNEEGIINVGLCYLNGFGTRLNAATALEWFRKVKKNTVGKFYFARLLMQGTNASRSIKQVKDDLLQARALLQEIPSEHEKFDEAQLNLGKSYINFDIGLAVNYFESIQNKKGKAAEQAQKELAILRKPLPLYFSSSPVQEILSGSAEEPESKVAPDEKKADSNCTEGKRLQIAAQTNKSNLSLAYIRFQVAHAYGSLLGRYELALCYLEGKGCPINVVEGKKLLRSAAEAKCDAAQFLLGNYLLKGKMGFNVDITEGVQWLNQAAKNNILAQRELITYYQSQPKTKSNLKKLSTYLQSVAQHESAGPKDWYQYGIFIKECDPENSILLLKKAAAKGYKGGGIHNWMPSIDWLAKLSLPEFIKKCRQRPAADTVVSDTKQKETKTMPAPKAKPISQSGAASIPSTDFITFSLFDADKTDKKKPILKKKSNAKKPERKAPAKNSISNPLLSILLAIENAIKDNPDPTKLTKPKYDKRDLQISTTYYVTKEKIKQLFKKNPREFYKFIQALDLLKFILPNYNSKLNAIMENTIAAKWIREKLSDDTVSFPAVILAINGYQDNEVDIDVLMNKQLATPVANKFEIDDRVKSELKNILFVLREKMKPIEIKESAASNPNAETKQELEPTITPTLPSVTEIDWSKFRGTTPKFIHPQKEDKIECWRKLKYMHPVAQDLLNELSNSEEKSWAHLVGSRVYDEPEPMSFDDLTRDIDISTNISLDKVDNFLAKKGFIEIKTFIFNNLGEDSVHFCQAKTKDGYIVEINCNAKANKQGEMTLRSMYADNDKNIYGTTKAYGNNKAKIIRFSTKDIKKLIVGDPGRMLITLGLLAKGYKYLPTREAEYAATIKEMIPHLNASPPTRLQSILDKNFVRGFSKAYLEFLVQYGAYDILFPNTAGKISERKEAYHFLISSFKSIDNEIAQLKVAMPKNINTRLASLTQCAYENIVIAAIMPCTGKTRDQVEKEIDITIKSLRLIRCQNNHLAIKENVLAQFFPVVEKDGSRSRLFELPSSIENQPSMSLSPQSMTLP